MKRKIGIKFILTKSLQTASICFTTMSYLRHIFHTCKRVPTSYATLQMLTCCNNPSVLDMGSKHGQELPQM